MRDRLTGEQTIPKIGKHLDVSDNTACVVTIAADEEEFWAIDSVVWSYDDTPTGGSLTFAWGGTTYLKVDITAGGPGQLDFSKAIFPDETKNVAAVVTLAAGGSGIGGQLTVRYR